MPNFWYQSLMKITYKLLENSDRERLADWLSSDTWPFFLGRTPTKEEVLKRVDSGDFFNEGTENFWILDSNEVPIGLVEINELDDLAPMFSIRLKSEFRGKSLGQPIVAWLTSYIFEKYPTIRRIEGQTREDNIPMRKVFNRSGYAKEAYYRFASPTEDGGRVASIAYGILREDWEQKKVTPVNWSSDSFFSEDII